MEQLFWYNNKIALGKYEKYIFKHWHVLFFEKFFYLYICKANETTACNWWIVNYQTKNFLRIILFSNFTYLVKFINFSDFINKFYWYHCFKCLHLNMKLLGKDLTKSYFTKCIEFYLSYICFTCIEWRFVLLALLIYNNINWMCGGLRGLHTYLFLNKIQQQSI